jgi:acyl-CoA oxidase
VRFNNVRLPRESLLSRYVQVAADGTYTVDQERYGKMVYSSMLNVRNYLVRSSPKGLARALTIAMRYSHFRQQFGDPERYVISYQYQQHRLLSFLGLTFAMQFGS